MIDNKPPLSTRCPSTRHQSVDGGGLFEVKMKEIKLNRGKIAIVDDCDYKWLSRWKWTYRECEHTGYAVRSYKIGINKRRIMRMHRMILQAEVGQKTDHIDGNGLNNQRSNLRLCTQLQNGRNRSINKNNKTGFKGVSFLKKHNRWMATIKVNYQDIYLGRYKTPEDAALAYNEAAKKHFGEFAWLNPM